MFLYAPDTDLVDIVAVGYPCKTMDHILPAGADIRTRRFTLAILVVIWILPQRNSAILLHGFHCTLQVRSLAVVKPDLVIQVRWTEHDLVGILSRRCRG
jgi:hypothetical protein